MFSKTLVLSALAALATAQSAVLSFTNVPNPVTDGQAQAITFRTNDTSSPISITLRQGLAGDLQDVEVLTGDAKDGQFVWTPSTSLPNGNDYALQIKQNDQVNYFGPFVVQGASASASAYKPSSMSSAMSSASASAMPIPSANGTTSAVVPVTPAGTAPMASGTGASMSRNTTMSIATLTATSTASHSSATKTNDAGFQGTGTSTDAPESTGAASSFQVGSGIALFGAIAAGIFLQ
jgi:hypothetical protein